MSRQVGQREMKRNIEIFYKRDSMQGDGACISNSVILHAFLKTGLNDLREQNHGARLENEGM